MRNKVSIIGAGMTGATTAHWLAERELADLVLVDVLEGMPQGKALDLQEALPVIGKDVELVGSNSYEATAGSDIIVITAGLPRKPGMSRDDLLVTNAGIVRKAVEESVKYSPDAIFVILTNPLDVMAYLAMKVGQHTSKSCSWPGRNFRLCAHAGLCGDGIGCKCRECTMLCIRWSWR